MMIYIVEWRDDDGYTSVVGASYNLDVAKQVRTYGMDGRFGDYEDVAWEYEPHLIGSDDWWGYTEDSDRDCKFACYHIHTVTVYESGDAIDTTGEAE